MQVNVFTTIISEEKFFALSVFKIEENRSSLTLSKRWIHSMKKWLRSQVPTQTIRWNSTQWVKRKKERNTPIWNCSGTLSYRKLQWSLWYPGSCATSLIMGFNSPCKCSALGWVIVSFLYPLQKSSQRSRAVRFIHIYSSIAFTKLRVRRIP